MHRSRRHGLTNGGAKFHKREWFGETDPAAFPKEPFGFVVDDVAGEKDHALGQRWIGGADALIDLLAVESGHFPVAKSKVVRNFSKTRESRFTIARNIHF